MLKIWNTQGAIFFLHINFKYFINVCSKICFLFCSPSFSQLDSSTWNIDMQELEYNPSKKDLTDARIHHLLAEELCKPYRRVSILTQPFSNVIFILRPPLRKLLKILTEEEIGHTWKKTNLNWLLFIILICETFF